MNRFSLDFLALTSFAGATAGDIMVLRIKIAANDGNGEIETTMFGDGNGDERGQVGRMQAVLKSYNKTNAGIYLTLSVDPELLEKRKGDIGSAAVDIQMLLNLKGINAIAGLHDEKAPTVTFFIEHNGEKVKATQVFDVKDTFVVEDTVFGLTNEGVYRLKGDKLGKKMVVISGAQKPNYTEITSVSRSVDGPHDTNNVFLNRGHNEIPLIGMIQVADPKNVELVVWGEAALSGIVFGSKIDGGKIVVHNGGVMELDHDSFVAAAYTPQQQASAG